MTAARSGLCQTPEALTREEEYMVWSERVRLLFQPPVSHSIDRSLLHSVYDRRYDDEEDSYPEPSFSHSEIPPLSSSSASWTQPKKEEPGTATYYDQGRFPLCFYSRMLRGASERPPHDSEEGLADDRSYTFSDVENFSSVSQPHCRSQPRVPALQPDRDDEAARLAAKLRAQAFQRRKASQKQNEMSRVLDAQSERVFLVDNFVFADPKVEAVQAALTEEMTSLLLTLRAANRQREDARAQLQYSRAIRQLASAGRTDNDDDDDDVLDRSSTYPTSPHSTSQRSTPHHGGDEDQYPSDFTD